MGGSTNDQVVAQRAAARLGDERHGVGAHEGMLRACEAVQLHVAARPVQIGLREVHRGGLHRAAAGRMHRGAARVGEQVQEPHAARALRPPSRASGGGPGTAPCPGSPTGPPRTGSRPRPSTSRTGAGRRRGTVRHPSRAGAPSRTRGRDARPAPQAQARARPRTCAAPAGRVHRGRRLVFGHVQERDALARRPRLRTRRWPRCSRAGRRRTRDSRRRLRGAPTCGAPWRSCAAGPRTGRTWAPTRAARCSEPPAGSGTLTAWAACGGSSNTAACTAMRPRPSRFGHPGLGRETRRCHAVVVARHGEAGALQGRPGAPRRRPTRRPRTRRRPRRDRHAARSPPRGAGSAPAGATAATRRATAGTSSAPAASMLATWRRPARLTHSRARATAGEEVASPRDAHPGEVGSRARRRIGRLRPRQRGEPPLEAVVRLVEQGAPCVLVVAVPSRRTPSARARGRVPDRKQRLPPRITTARRPRMPGRPARRRQPRRPPQPGQRQEARPPARTKARRPPPHRAAGRCADAERCVPPGPTTRWRCRIVHAHVDERVGVSVRPHRARSPRSARRRSHKASFTLSAVNCRVAQLVVRSAARARPGSRPAATHVLPRAMHARPAYSASASARVHARPPPASRARPAATTGTRATPPRRRRRTRRPRREAHALDAEPFELVGAKAARAPPGSLRTVPGCVLAWRRYPIVVRMGRREAARRTPGRLRRVGEP